MKRYLVQTPTLVDGKRGLRFGKWITRFSKPTLQSALAIAEKLRGKRPFRILHGGKRVD